MVQFMEGLWYIGCMERSPRFSPGQTVREFETGLDIVGVVEVVAEEEDGSFSYKLEGYSCAWYNENVLIAVLG